MSLNWKEINQIVIESDIKHMSIAHVVQPDFDQLIFVLRDAHTVRKLRICHQQRFCCLHCTEMRTLAIKKPPRFMQLLNTRLAGAHIINIAQFADQRIVRFSIMSGDMPYYLYLRLWSGAANTFLTTAANIIIDSYYRRPLKGEVSGAAITPIIEQIFTKANRHAFPCAVRDYREPSLSQHIDNTYRIFYEDTVRNRLRHTAQETLRKRIGHIDNMLRKYSDTAADGALRYKRYGDLLLQNAHMISGAVSEATITDDESNTTLTIPLDIRKSVQQNAHAYYQRYKKHKQKQIDTENYHTMLRNEQSDLTQLLNRVERYAITDLHTVMKKYTTRTHTDASHHTHTVGIHYQSHRFTLLVGTSAQESDLLLRKYVKAYDMWVHVRNKPGGSVFIKYRSGKSIPQETLYDASTLAHYYSKARNEGYVDVHYTHVKYLRRAKNAKRGTVIAYHDKSLTFKFDASRLVRLQQSRSSVNLKKE